MANVLVSRKINTRFDIDTWIYGLALENKLSTKCSDNSTIFLDRYQKTEWKKVETSNHDFKYRPIQKEESAEKYYFSACLIWGIGGIHVLRVYINCYQ